jgi:hypothetical protein
VGVGFSVAPEVAAWLLRDGVHRLVEGDLDEMEAWMLDQLPLPPVERWR